MKISLLNLNQAIIEEVIFELRKAGVKKKLSRQITNTKGLTVSVFQSFRQTVRLHIHAHLKELEGEKTCD